MPSAGFDAIHAVVRGIPRGYVTTYGAVARRAGAATPRIVGFALAGLSDSSGIPWHRVVNARGMISLGGESGSRQRELLELEGVAFNRNGRIDLDTHGWGGLTR